jgi:hypothetical protein
MRTGWQGNSAVLVGPAHASASTWRSEVRLARVPELGSPPSERAPLTGGCLCGGVQFELTGPFTSAGYCHCTHCQRRTGTGSSAQGRIPQGSFRLLSGQELLHSFTPEGGRAKVFCSRCGSSVFGGDPLNDDEVSVRLGVLDGDPGIRPQYRSFTDSAAAWEPIPDDGLERFAGRRV